LNTILALKHALQLHSVTSEWGS